MQIPILDRHESVHIRLGKDQDIVSASDAIFQPEHQDESRTMIFEAEYIFDHLAEFASLLNLGAAKYAAVTEPGRQTVFRYGKEGADAIMLTKAHGSVEQLLEEMNKA